ncbi:MAG TPA: DUF4333 domain-containing protein [Actinomycetota bacterium]|nr:DUF4333 domain-containing protein [Actinomycetota bacterium]
MAPDATLRVVLRGASRRVFLALLLAVPLGIGSCVPRTLRIGELERRLAGEVSETLDVHGIRVECPNGIEVRPGDTFRCTATDPFGDVIRIVVTQVDDEGSIAWEVASGAE